MSFWHWIVRRKQEEREMNEEIRFHLAEEARLRKDRGQPPDAVRRDFGNVTAVQELTREAWGWTAVDRAWKDLQYAARMMQRSPGFAAVAIAALALGIGATTAIFSVVNSVLLKPLLFPDPERLVMVWEVPPGATRTNVVQTQNFLDWRSRNLSFEAIAALHAVPVNLAGEGEPVQVTGLRVTAGFFEILGVPPLLGRGIREADDARGAPCVTVLSHALWQQRFGGRAGVVGEKILLAGSSCEVCWCDAADIPVPHHPRRALRADADRWHNGTARRTQLLHRGPASPRRHSGGCRRGDADSGGADGGRTPEPEREVECDRGPADRTDRGLHANHAAGADGRGGVCAADRMPERFEPPVDARVGAPARDDGPGLRWGRGRWRLMHQMAIESLLLAAAGGSLGFLLAWWGVPALIGMLPAGFPLPRMQEIAVDRSVLSFTLVVSLGCGLFFGLFPALQVDRARLGEGLRQGGRHGTSGGRTLRNVLVVAEVAMAVLLVIGAGLMLRSFQLLNHTDPGFRADHLVTFRMLLLPSKYIEIARRAPFLQAVLERVRALPMVTSAGSIHLLPMTGMQSGTGYNRKDRPEPPPGNGIGGDVSVISDRYFQTMGIPLLAGPRLRCARPHRLAVRCDSQPGGRAIPVSGESPLGKRLRIGWFPQNDVEIVGVAGDIRHSDLAQPPNPTVFLASAQGASLLASLVVRYSGDTASAVAAVKEQLRAIDPDQGIEKVQSMEELVSDQVARPRLQATVLGVFGAVALVLACLGIYAVISYSVVQRTREMGIRLALGAAPLSILRGVIGEGMALSAAGITLGIGAAFALTRYLEKLLYTIHPTDPSVYAAVCALLAGAALAGCYFPARRATRVDPAVVLRDE